MTKSVAELCAEQAITVGELAANSGLENDRVTAIVLGRWTPSPAERNRVATALGVKIEDITWGHKTPIQHIYGHGPG